MACQIFNLNENIGFSVMIRMGNLGMEKRPLRFSLHEAFFKGSRSRGRAMASSVRSRSPPIVFGQILCYIYASPKQRQGRTLAGGR